MLYLESLDVVCFVLPCSCNSSLNEYVTMWYDTMWYDMIWCDMIGCDMMWYDTMWYDTICYDMMWYDMMWYGTIWYDFPTTLKGGKILLTYLKFFFVRHSSEYETLDSDLKVNRNIYPDAVAYDRMRLIGPKSVELFLSTQDWVFSLDVNRFQNTSLKRQSCLPNDPKIVVCICFGAFWICN